MLLFPNDLNLKTKFIHKVGSGIIMQIIFYFNLSVYCSNFAFEYVSEKKNGDTEEDVKTRIQKARVAFIMLRNIWRAKQIKLNTKLRIFNSNVKAVLLYGSETWRSTQKTLKRIQTFINKCLRRILCLKWSDNVPNTTLSKIK